MTLSRRIPFLAGAAVIPLTALSLVGGAQVANAGSTHSAIESSGAVNTASLTRTRPTLQRRRSRLGEILVDSRGRTLYLFKLDARKKSRCSGSCAANWPPLLVTGRPVAGKGVKSSKLGTTRRSDGKTQVVYNGHPLYRFIGDRSPGSTTGQGLTAFGARWFVVSPAGNEIR
jgi:predicted lipoprotein with Yx(FWY)xxD motif